MYINFKEKVESKAIFFVYINFLLIWKTYAGSVQAFPAGQLAHNFCVPSGISSTNQKPTDLIIM